MTERGPCHNYPDEGCPNGISVERQGLGFCCYQCLDYALPPPQGQRYVYDEPEKLPAIAVLEPEGDPVGTVRRQLGDGLCHFIKLEQVASRECWLPVDAYGAMSDLWGRLLREDEVQEEPVVYTPDGEWGKP